jgi:predicted RNase H-like HicB family nuclease
MPADLNQTDNRRGSECTPVHVYSWNALKSSFDCEVAFFRSDDSPGYTAVATKFPGVVSQGDSLDEAVCNVKEALEAAIAFYLLDGEAIPSKSNWFEVPAGSIKRRVRVDVSTTDN